MEERSLDQKLFQAHPDTFDIIKVTAMTAGAVLEKGMIVHIVAIDADKSGLPESFEVDHNYVISEPTTLVEDDSVKLLGYKRNYSAIQFATQPTFANDLTSVIVAGKGKNMSLFNSVTSPITVPGYFNQIQIPEGSATTVIVAYR
jgi:hypothetical protein